MHKDGRVRVGGKIQPVILTTDLASVCNGRVDVLTSGKGDCESLAERLKKLGFLGDVALISGIEETGRLRTIRNRKMKLPRVRHHTIKNFLVVDLVDKRATCKPEPIVRTTSEVHELAIKTVRMLGADPVKEAVDYLTAVFRTVSTGNVLALASANGSVTAQNSGPVTAVPLAAARARGRRFAFEEYESPDNLALLDARDYAGRNDRTINDQRLKGELYALLPPGKTRGFRYPKWQFDATPARLVCVLHPFVDAKANSWVIHSFMRRERDELDGKSPLEIILDDGASIAPVVDLASRDFAGEQGAT
ncbi:hypothetical protein [Pararobbsia alpina]|uniref:hypothetical protein n=1 Tax=Pararobbsia alpina TaxID=621374 RepID=UPI001583B23E|nr:hypothetical protein [Pararobbsia alpina]